MEEYGITLTGDLAVDEDNAFDMGSPEKRIRTVYVHDIDSTSTSDDFWFTGGTEPPETRPGDPWFNTANKILQIRNNADDGWLGVMYGDDNNKIWMYSNSASDGWAIDASVTDVVIALKGGVDEYNYDGGTTNRGDFDPGDHDHAGGSHDHGVGPHTHSVGAISAIEWGAGDVVGSLHGGPPANTGPGSGTTDAGGTEDTGLSGADATYRPEAAVGTLQYPDSVV